VLERPGLLLGEDDHLAGSLCESLEHGCDVPSLLGGEAVGWSRGMRTHPSAQIIDR
jgi:hypothetical protein